MSTVEEVGGVFEVRRLGLALALTLLVAAIALGTWVLGSDPAEERAPSVADLSAPERAQPPLLVAPPPAAKAG